MGESLTTYSRGTMAAIGSKLSGLVKAGMDGAGPRLATFLSYAKVELVPPTPAEVGAAIGGISKVAKTGMTLGFTKMPVKEAWVNTLVGTEIICWFFIGECIGKGSIIGYQV